MSCAVREQENGKVLTTFMKSASILFYVNYTADPVRSNNLHEHNENDETQEDVEADAKQGQNKSTNETAHAASIAIQTQNNFSNKVASENLRFCDWAMDSSSVTGSDTPHQERCVGTMMPMKTCTIEGCSTNVHPLCHNDWLISHCYARPTRGKHVCREHSKCYQKWVLYRAGKIARSDNGCILSEYGCIPGLAPGQIPLDRNKSTNETAQAASNNIQTQNDSSNDPGPPKSRCCDWANGSFSRTGFDTPHQERCISVGARMKTCTMKGCSTMVHTFCHNNWLDAHCYLQAPPGQHVCRQHSNSYKLWVRYRAGKIPRSENGCIPGSAAATD